jgi:hypothetical protein
MLKLTSEVKMSEEVKCQECGRIFLVEVPPGDGSDLVCPACADLIVTSEEEDFDDYPLSRNDA